MFKGSRLSWLLVLPAFMTAGVACLAKTSDYSTTSDNNKAEVKRKALDASKKALEVSLKAPDTTAKITPKAAVKLPQTDGEWKKKLPPFQYYVTRQKGTEPAFTGKYWNNHEAGVYRCADCGAPLFNSSNKFDSGTGWPSFDRPVAQTAVKNNEDSSFGIRRDEVICSQCGAHLGHVFDDGPQNTTGKRFCINSASLEFAKAAKPQ